MLNRWAGDTVCIIASGPSLTRADADFARLAAKRVIVINESWRMCPASDVLYAADAAWWRSRAPKLDEFAGERWVSTRNTWGIIAPPPWLRSVKTVPGNTLAKTEPLGEGSNSAFQALGLAVLWGARRVVFLGLDLAHSKDLTHWHGNHKDGLSNPDPRVLRVFADAFATIAPDLEARGVEVINASRQTALKCFPRKLITEALP